MGSKRNKRKREKRPPRGAMTLKPENPIDPQQAATDTHGKSDKQTNDPKAQVAPAAAQPQTKPPKEHCEVTCNTKRDWIDWATLALEGFGLAVLIVYTIATIAIWCANKRVAEDTHKSVVNADRNFRLDERAWVSPHITTGDFRDKRLFGDGSPLVVPIVFQNTGKTPAIHVQTCVIAEFVKNDTPTVDTSCPDKAKNPGFDLIFPNDHIIRPCITTGKCNVADNDPEGLLRIPLRDDLLKGRKALYLRGRVDYRDIFNHPHWVTFCSMLLIMPPTQGGLPYTFNWLLCENTQLVDSEPNN
jgi:hypothetical protein